MARRRSRATENVAAAELPGWWTGPPGTIEGPFRAVTEVYELDAEWLARVCRFAAASKLHELIADDIKQLVTRLPYDHPAVRVYGASSTRDIAAELRSMFCGNLDDRVARALAAQLESHAYRTDDMAVAFPYVTLAPAAVGRGAEQLHLPGPAVGQLARAMQRLALCVAMTSMRLFAAIRDRQLVSMEQLAGDSAELARVGADLKVLASTDDPAGLGAAVNQASAAFAELDRLTAQVGSVVELVRGLAAQTKLLALNATIEAAHAGEEGHGFRVVAAEVKSLAGSTDRSLQTIKSLTEEITASVAQATACMGMVDDAATRVEASAEHVSALSDRLLRSNDHHQD